MCECSDPPPAIVSAERAAWHTRRHIRHPHALCDLWCQLPSLAKTQRPQSPFLVDSDGISPPRCRS